MDDEHLVGRRSNSLCCYKSALASCLPNFLHQIYRVDVYRHFYRLLCRPHRSQRTEKPCHCFGVRRLDYYPHPVKSLYPADARRQRPANYSFKSVAGYNSIDPLFDVFDLRSGVCQNS